MTATTAPKKTRASRSRKATPPAADRCACGWVPTPGQLWPSLGGVAVRWIEDNLIFAEGDWYGQPFRCRPDQKLFLWRWYSYCPNCQEWRYAEALRGAATGDGKTALIAAIACLEFAGPDSIAPSSPNIPIAAASFAQADLLFSVAATMLGGIGGTVTEAPLCGLFDVFDTEIKFKDGRPGRMFRVAAAAGTNEGGLPHLFICDELHEWGDVGSTKARVHTVIGKSTTKRRTQHGRGRILNLSTAGFDVDHSLLGALYKQGKLVEKDPTIAPRFLFDWQEAPEGLDYEDPKQREIAVRAASKAAGLLWNVADRVADWNKPGFEHQEWVRYYANAWLDISEDSWLAEHPNAWPACRGVWTSDSGNPFVISVDMALKHDQVGVVRTEKLPDDRIAVTSWGWKADKGGRIDHVAVWQHVKDQAVGKGFQGVVYDPRFFELPARQLEDEGILVIQFDQTIERMGPACGLALEVILDKRLVHNGDPELGWHVKAAAKRQTERGFTLSKGRSKRHIDRCVAMVMGISRIAQAAEPKVAAAASSPPLSQGGNPFRDRGRLQI